MINIFKTETTIT